MYANFTGGLGSSWSSFILGEEARGEAFGDIFGDNEGWGIGTRESNPETSWGSSAEAMGPLEDKAGFIDIGLLVSGPEKACLLTFLVSDVFSALRCGSESPSAKGGGSRMAALLLLLSLSTDCASDVVGGPDMLSSPESLSYFLGSKGEEYHKLLVPTWTFVGLVRGTELLVLEGVELFAPAGMGSTYVRNFCVDGCVCLALSDGSLFSADIGAE